MKTNNKKGFTIVELVIVIAIIAVLAAVLIPTFASIIKKAEESAYLQERTNQQIQDLTEKIENNNYMTWEDFEEKLAEALASLGNNPDPDQIKQAVLDAIGDKFNTTGLTEEQVRKIIDKALESQLTDTQVKAIVDAAIKNLSGNSLTEAQVKSIVQSAINALPSNVGITKEQMTKAIADAISTVSPGLNEQDVADAIANALDNFKSELLTEEQVANLVREILDSLQPEGPEGIGIATFAELQTAFATGGVYYLTNNFEVTNAIQTTHDLVLDLNGHNLYLNSANQIDGTVISALNCNLTFNDSLGNGGVYNIKEGYTDALFGMFGTANFTINGGTFLSTHDMLFGGVGGSAGGSFTINGGTILGYVGTLQGKTIVLGTEMTLYSYEEFMTLEDLGSSVVAAEGYSVTKTYESMQRARYTCTKTN